MFGQNKIYGLVVDYVGIFDDVAKALNFDEETARKIISNIDALRGKIRDFVEKYNVFFPGVDRTRNDWEGLLEAQNCLPDNETKDAFGAEYRVLNKVWNALSPDDCLMPFKADYRWRSKVYDSIRPRDDSGRLIWAAPGGKTLALVHENIGRINKQQKRSYRSQKSVRPFCVKDRNRTRKPPVTLKINQ